MLTRCPPKLAEVDRTGPEAQRITICISGTTIGQIGETSHDQANPTPKRCGFEAAVWVGATLRQGGNGRDPIPPLGAPWWGAGLGEVRMERRSHGSGKIAPKSKGTLPIIWPEAA